MTARVPAPSFPAGETLNSREAKQARALHDAILACSKEIRDIQDRHVAAQRSLQEANVEMKDFLYGPETDEKRELELADDLRLARLRADEGAFRTSIQGAQDRHEQAVQEYTRYVQCNLEALLAELAPEAYAGAEARAEALAALVPVQQRFDEIRLRVERLLMHVRPSRVFTPEEVAENEAWNLPADGSAPLPRPEVVAAWMAAHPAEAEAQPVEPEAREEGEV